MKRCCPECNSTNVATEKRPDGNSNCKDCKFTGPTAKFPMGSYKIPLPSLQEEIDKWCDDASVSKEGFFYKNSSKMCADVLASQIKPWEDENKKLKLLIDVLEMRMGFEFVSQALKYINEGNDTIPNIVEDDDGKEVQKGILILSYQHTLPKVEELDSSNAGQGGL